MNKPSDLETLKTGHSNLSISPNLALTVRSLRFRAKQTEEQRKRFMRVTEHLQQFLVISTFIKGICYGNI
jgi:hypothetical protein